MDEQFLHFIWKYQKFESLNLKTVDGEDVVVFDTGHHNHNSGPDFEEARIKIGNVEWAGNVEIHLKSSDWDLHQHSDNKAYDNVILHVVWQHDHEVLINGQPIPTMELNNLVNDELFRNYSQHISQKEPIACSNQLTTKLDMPYGSMIDRVLVERLERKASHILETLRTNKNDWDETCYQVLMQNFGFSVNKHAFLRLSAVLPFAILKKYLSAPEKTEALLFGQAGFLEEGEDSYLLTLSKEYKYLATKHQLPTAMQRHQWKFGRMRPANFPSLRIAQVAALLSCHPRFFTKLTDSPTFDETSSLFEFQLPKYWREHYDFGKARKPSPNAIGLKTKENLIINTIAPLLTAYSKFTNTQAYLDRAVSILEEVKPEQNSITKRWSALDRPAANAFESQAQIQLYNEYCSNRKCLSCAVGVSLLNK